MTIEKMFEVATRSKMRFPFRGLISVEDMWDLGLTDLDSIFKTLNAELKDVKEESLLGEKTQQNTELEIKIEIIKYIVKVKQDELNARKEAKARKEQEQQLLKLIAEKKNESLQGKTIEELEAMLNELKK